MKLEDVIQTARVYLETADVKRPKETTRLRSIEATMRENLPEKPSKHQTKANRERWHVMVNAIRTVSSIADAIEKGKTVSKLDTQALHALSADLGKHFPKAAATVQPPAKKFTKHGESLADLASVPKDVFKPAIAPVTASGPSGNDEMNLENLTKQIDIVNKLAAYKGKLPTTIPAGVTFVIARAPIIITTPTSISNSSLDRAFPDQWQRISSALWFKTSVKTNTWSFVVEDQIFIGVHNDDDMKDTVKKYASPMTKTKGTKDNPSMISRRDVKVGTINAGIMSLEHRLGPMANMMLEHGSGYIRSPGNPLAWIWVVPQKVHSLIGSIKIASIAFPWSNPPRAEDTINQQKAAERELKSLEERRTLFRRNGGDLSPQDDARTEELRKFIGQKPEGLTTEDKGARIARLRKLAEAEFEKELSIKEQQIKSLTEEMKSGGYNAKDIRKFKTDIAAIRKHIDERKAEIWKKYQNMP